MNALDDLIRHAKARAVLRHPASTPEEKAKAREVLGLPTESDQ